MGRFRNNKKNIKGKRNSEMSSEKIIKKTKHEVQTTKHKVSGHGSITKAGKVRNTTPKIPVTVKHKKSFPRIRNRRNYEKRELLKRKIGQNE